MSEVRVRFAPSPTGFLHIGGVRTALYSWLYARRHGGRFLLRIEDTDTERSEERFTQDIFASLQWLGLEPDEPILYQSQRFDVYRQRAEELVRMGHAYRCTCSEADVEAMRQKALSEGRKPKYDGRCRERNLTSDSGGTPFVIRLKVPQTSSVAFDDLIHGRIEVQNDELDDFVIIRSNGTPTYNFVVVVDDIDMRMTHIIRGDDHINNTPKQLHLYQYFGYPPPKYAHLPMILGPDKKKLSKRHGDVSTTYYRGEGYLPEAVLNFLVRLGWSHGDQEVFTVQEMIDLFDFDHVQKSAAVFNTEKFLWLNGVHIRGASPERLAAIVKEDFKDFFQPEALSRIETTIGLKLIAFIQPKVKLLKEMAQQLVPLCTPGPLEVDAAMSKWGKKPEEMKPVIQNAIRRAVEGLEARLNEAGAAANRSGADQVWGDSPSLGDAGLSPTDIDGFLRQVGDEHGVKLGELAQPMRLVITGQLVSAGLFELLAVLPWDLVKTRLQHVQDL